MLEIAEGNNKKISMNDNISSLSRSTLLAIEIDIGGLVKSSWEPMGVENDCEEWLWFESSEASWISEASISSWIDFIYLSKIYHTNKFSNYRNKNTLKISHSTKLWTFSIHEGLSNYNY